MSDAKRRTDETAVPPRRNLKPAEMQELRRRLQAMVTEPGGMERFLTSTVGAGNFQYDPMEDVWVVPDTKHRGLGRRFYIVRPNGTWFDAILPEHELS